MITRSRACKCAHWGLRPWQAQRRLSQRALDRLKEPVQSYISSSRDPFLNLSIEHYLLQKTAPESTVLFLYVNRPSIIIGRNQNPWLEVNLALLDPARDDRPETEPPGLGAVDLVRRRSGGGTVFHDEGNVNWTVICPSKSFTRDKHAEMVVRALRARGVDRSRVNERHDIVLDQGQCTGDVDPEDTHATAYTSGDIRPLKVSGSAYKLTRQRALHHGTCLLSSPNLNIIPDYLHSPAKPYITARGVESVSSPVGNILLSNDEFITGVQEQFAGMYGKQIDAEKLGEDWLGDQTVHKGYDELKSLEWTYGQTPQFDVSVETDAFELNLCLRNSALTSGHVAGRAGNLTTSKRMELPSAMVGLRVHDARSWSATLGSVLKDSDPEAATQLIEWLQKMLPSPPSAR